MYSIFLSVCVSAIAFVLWIQSTRENPKKIFDVYAQPGKWYYLKYLIFLALLKIRQIRSKHFQNKKGSGGLGQNVNESESQLEQLKELSSHEKAFDAVFFQAVTQDGYYLAAGIERRHGGKINGLFYLATPDYGLLLSDKLPNTLLDADPLTLHSMKAYSGGGITFTPIKPMKTWRVQYNGKMRLEHDPETLVNVIFEAEWTSEFPYFLFDTGMSIKAIARATAREEWTKEYFENLKSAHQTHYEQMGHLKGTLAINNEKRLIEMDAFRDHSFGHKRDWTLMHRYIFHMMYLSDGTRITIGVVSQPSTTSHLEMGYVVLPDKSIHSIDSCDLLLYQHGESGIPPKNLAFCLKANGRTYEVSVDKVEYQSVHYKGNDVEAKMFERFLKYRVNGVTGRGVSEWHYNNVDKE